ncbi:MAG: DNA helicase RecQ [Chlorobiaceae bacterium]|nr:DNA helicase RecQ [Chlorobiaceae bacterium]NTW75029.1 DNA helicase RecQ [Chlorobiaceae bacterium]
MSRESAAALDTGVIHAELSRLFGFSSFRPNQMEAVTAILRGGDLLAIMPTGGGKSLCYQLPAVLLPGTALVVSPLISLMKDQVDGAVANGIRAAFLNSSLSAEDRAGVMRALLDGSLDLLYVAPERFALDHFQELLGRLQISMAVIDEAHCISEWGHDFRPDYLALSAIRKIRPDIPVAAFTATATPRVQEDIVQRLGMNDPSIVLASFDRPNLSYEIREKTGGERQLVSLLKEFPGQSGIIYRTSRKSVNDTAAMLSAKGFSALPYHAGLSDGERLRNQDAFIRDEVDIIVATVAFGMGIDKSNVRFVIHADLPRSIENYYQETGRAGRDGDEARCVMLFSMGDIPKVRFFIDSMLDEEERARALSSLSKIVSFASSTVCRRKKLLGHFGEVYPEENCGSCDVCLGTKEVTECTTEAQMLLSAIIRTDSRFGAGHIVDILVGADTQKVREFGHDRLNVYGLGKGKPKTFWRRLIDELAARRIVARSEGLYPVLYPLERAMEVLKNGEKVEMVRVEAKRPGKHAARNAASDTLPGDQDLFERLRALRKELASSQGVPPYIVFTDRTLHEMAARKPTTPAEMLAIPGVGESKLRKYAQPFLDLLRGRP